MALNKGHRHSISSEKHSLMTDRSSPASLAGLLAVGLGVCCGIPVLASLGVLGAIAGSSTRSWFLVAIGVTAVAIESWRWWHRRAPRRQSNDTPSSNTPDHLTHLTHLTLAGIGVHPGRAGRRSDE